MAAEEKDLLQYLVNYLKQKGYPEDSLLLNYKEHKYRSDLVVVDPETLNTLQIFELRDYDANAVNKHDNLQMKHYTDETSKINPDVTGYLVFPIENAPYFKIIDPISNQTVSEVVFDYRNQVQKGKNANISILKKNKNRAVGNLKWVTGGLIFLTGLVLILDVFDVVEITGYRLYLILMIVVFVLLPYYETIKVASFELTQKNKEKS